VSAKTVERGRKRRRGREKRLDRFDKFFPSLHSLSNPLLIPLLTIRSFAVAVILFAISLFSTLALSRRLFPRAGGKHRGRGGGGGHGSPTVSLDERFRQAERDVRDSEGGAGKHL